MKTPAGRLLAANGDDVQAIAIGDEDIVRLQDERHVGFEAMVQEILRVADRHLQRLNQRRETCPPPT